LFLSPNNHGLLSSLDAGTSTPPWSQDHTSLWIRATGGVFVDVSCPPSLSFRSHSIISSIDHRLGSHRRQLNISYAAQLCWLIAYACMLQDGKAPLLALQRAAMAVDRTQYCMSGFGVASSITRTHPYAPEPHCREATTPCVRVSLNFRMTLITNCNVSQLFSHVFSSSH
jgi:hypothetical protein